MTCDSYDVYDVYVVWKQTSLTGFDLHVVWRKSGSPAPDGIPMDEFIFLPEPGVTATMRVAHDVAIEEAKKVAAEHFQSAYDAAVRGGMTVS